MCIHSCVCVYVPHTCTISNHSSPLFNSCNIRLTICGRPVAIGWLSKFGQTAVLNYKVHYFCKNFSVYSSNLKIPSGNF